MTPLPFPLPERGVYFEQTLRRRPRIAKLPWYLAAPSAGLSMGSLHDGLDAGVIFGPVHEAEQTLATHGFISILVPPPWSLLPVSEKERLPALVWVNIYKNKDRHGHPAEVHWARPVSQNIVSEWVRQGWQHHFYDGVA